MEIIEIKESNLIFINKQDCLTTATLAITTVMVSEDCIFHTQCLKQSCGSWPLLIHKIVFE
jgi:hypothetical protein